MEIVKKGSLPSERMYEASCNHCGTVMRFKQSEGKVTHDQRDGSTVSVACPVCLYTVYKDLHSYLKEEPQVLNEGAGSKEAVWSNSRMYDYPSGYNSSVDRSYGPGDYEQW